MRAQVDISEAQAEALDALAARQRRPRASLVHAAIEDYLVKHRLDRIEEGFGLWKDEPIDGLAFQDEMRREW